MNRNKILDTVDCSALMEYGLYPAPLINILNEKNGCKAVVAALNNADTDYTLLKLIDNKSAKLFEGINIAAEVVGAEHKILHLPEKCRELGEKLAAEAEKNGVEIVYGIVNVRANADNLVCHIVTLIDLAEAVSGEYEQGIYVSFDGGEVKKYPVDTVLGTLLPENVKAVRIGYKICGKEALKLTLEDADIQNGTVIGYTDENCVVDAVDKKLLACREQSCGKCVFCREGLLQLEAMQKDMTIGKGTLGQLDMTKEIGEAMCFSCSCSLGLEAAKLPLSAIEACKGEYEEHIKKHRCPADVCIALRKIYIEPTACTGCTKCMEVCPVDAIDGAAGYIHIIFDNDCTKCEKCIDACPEGAVKLSDGRVPRLPDRMMRVGRFK